MEGIDLSVVIPAHNEEGTLKELFAELSRVLGGLGRSWEVLLIDDGSTDDTQEVIRSIAASKPEAKGIFLPFRQGKAAALSAGFRASKGSVAVTLDADLQDDPYDLPRFLEKLEQGCDLVCGWRKQRRDPWNRRAGSFLFNVFTSSVLGPKLHDHNCGFKAYRREVLEQISLYGDLHRFATFLAHNLGFRVAEVVVHHRPRRSGKSRYGMERVWRSLLDVFTCSMLTRKESSVFRWFASTGIPFSLAGLFLCLGLLLFLPEEAAYRHTPRFLAGILVFLLGVQVTAAGLLGELIMSVWWESRLRARKKKGLLSVLLCGSSEKLLGKADRSLKETKSIHYELVVKSGRKGTASPSHNGTESIYQGYKRTERLRGERFLLLEEGGEEDIEELLACLRKETTGPVFIAASGRACLGRSEVLDEFPGLPVSLNEFLIWCEAAGVPLGLCAKEGRKGRKKAGLLSKLRYFSLYFLGRYHSRPLHFFAVLGFTVAFLGAVLGLAVKVSLLSGMRRYFLMELSLGFAVAGVELFVAGLLGELLVYLRGVLSRERENPRGGN